MVRETRHLWVGNLPDNIREDRIREHFKRYGRVQSVKLLPRSTKEETSEGTMACTVAFMDIKSASKAHTAEHKIDDRTLTTEYYEPAAIPSSASPQNTPSSYSTSPGSTRFPNGHGTTEEHGAFNDRFYERTNSRVADPDFARRTGYHDNNRGRTRDRGYRNGPYNNVVDRTHRPINSWTPYDSTRYNSQTNETGYSTTPTETNERRPVEPAKKKTKSRSGSRSPSPGSTSSRSLSRSGSRSSSSSSSSSTSRATSSSGSPKSRRLGSSHQPVVHSEDRRPLAICVRNLPVRSSDTSLKDGLFHEYKKHGKVTWVKVVGQSSERHAIVCFKKPEDVEKALEVSYDKMFFGSKIEVAPYQGYDIDDSDLRPYEAEIDEFHPKATRTLFIGNLEKDITASDLRKHFDQFGEIIEIDIKKQGAVSSYAFCQYSDIVSVVKAIRSMDGEHLGNNRIKLGFGKSMPTNCVWVDGVTEGVTEKYLMMQFDPFGSITQVIIDREKGQALIFYDQALCAQSAVIKMRGAPLRGRKMQVDFASRECQEAFYEHLEKQGHVLDKSNFEERRESRDSTTRSFESATLSSTARFAARYEATTRPRTASYGSRTNASTGQCNTGVAIPSPGTPGSGTPRGNSTRSRLTRYPDFYEQGGVELAERHFRSYDEFSQGSAASHEDFYDPEYPYNHDSPNHIEVLETRTAMVSPTVETVVPKTNVMVRLQKERVHLLDSLEDGPSSGDELIGSKKRLKLDHLDNANDVIIEANRDHRKVMEVRRLSDVSLKHHSRRPSVDSKHSRDAIAHERVAYIPHGICKRRKTAGSDSGSRMQHYDHSGSESVGGSRPGTPLCDERPEHFTPSEPRRIPREREGPLSLPLPKFAAHVMNRGSVSVAGIKGQKDNVLSSPPPAVTSPRISNPKPPSPAQVPPPASPPPRPPSLSSNSSDSDIAPPSPSLDERIKSLDEKYEKWSGSRALSAAGNDALAKLDANSQRFRFRHKLLDLDLKELQPSEIVKSVMAKRSVFDEDLKRLENVGEKYEPRDYNVFPRSTAVVQTTVPAAPLPTLQPLKVSAAVQLPKTPTMLSPRSTGTTIPAAKGLQYPFPTHPPVQPTVAAAAAASTTATPTATLLAPTSSSTTTRGSHGDNRLKPFASVSSDNRTSSKVSVNRTASNCSLVSNLTQTKTVDSCKSGGVIPLVNSDAPSGTDVKQGVGVKLSDKVTSRRDSATSNSASPRGDVKSRRNSDTGGRKFDDSSDSHDSSASERLRNEEWRREHQRLDKIRAENEKFEKERLEKEKLEKERLEKEKAERERLEKEKEVERLEKEKLEKERIEKEKAEKERLERERLEREKRREREEKERREKEERERREREEQLEKERRERREREERERREREERERKEREEKEKREREEKERREREEKEKREKEDEERAEKEKLEKEKERKREKEVERKHKDDNHDKRKEDHSRHRENHSESKHRENNVDFRSDKHSHDNKNTKEHRDSHELNKKDSHESRNCHESKESKSRHHSERESEKKKELSKENSSHDRSRNCINEIREYKDRPSIESRHMSLDMDKNRHVETNTSSSKSESHKKKERNNSLPASIGSKRRISSHDSLDNSEECKRIKLSSDHKKQSERRDSKDSSRSDEKLSSKVKHKNSSSKSHDDKQRTERTNNTVKESGDERRKEKEREERHRHKQVKLDKQKVKKNREKETTETNATTTPSTPPGKDKDSADKEFLARLELRANDESEKQKQQRREIKEKRKESSESSEHKEDNKQRSEERKKDRHPTSEKKPREGQQIKTNDDGSKVQKKERIRKLTQNSSDNNSDSDEPKKHSIFDIVDDEPAYISMYDKVKARSCKNMQKLEEEKRQEKIKAKFCQLKQSRARREEKKRSTSWDEDSDSDRERHDTKVRRGNKMLIASSDEEDERSSFKPRKRDVYVDSDSEKAKHLIKQDSNETSDDDRIRVKNLQRKGSRSRIASDSSDEEYSKVKAMIKSDNYFDMDTENNFADTEEKPFRKLKEEFDEKFVKKERKINKLHESLEQINANIFGDSNSPVPDMKQEPFNSGHSCLDNSSADESADVKKDKSELRKKHKKKQRRPKPPGDDDDDLTSQINAAMELLHSDGERIRHLEKKKQHAKKEKKKDRGKEEERLKERSKKSKKIKDMKHDGKMENIFGPLSDDSSNGLKDDDDNHSGFFNKYSDENAHAPSAYVSDSDSLSHERELLKAEEKERIIREEHRRRKEKRRREKERRLREELNNENSMDYADMGKLLEENIKDDSPPTVQEEFKDRAESEKSAREPYDATHSFNDTSEQELSKEARKELREKKKKRKKSKEERQNRHHHSHHHDKTKPKSPDAKKESTTEEETLTTTVNESKENQHQSLPSILDLPNSPISKSSNYSVSPTRVHEPLSSPKTPSNKEKKREKLFPGFGRDIDEKIHENAVKSIPEFEIPKEDVKAVVQEEVKPEKLIESTEEKPRVVISQEETEDAVAALLGESFGENQFSNCYEDDLSQNSEQVATVTEDENIQQDDEEMRQAVQSLNTSADLEMKPDTPQSENDLQIDTDTEEQEESVPAPRYEQSPRTPDMVDLSHPPKTPDIPVYYRPDEPVKSTTIILKATSIGSPPSLTPIKPHAAVVTEVKRNLDNALQVAKSPSLPSLPSLQPNPKEESDVNKTEQKTPPAPSTEVTVHSQSIITQHPTTVSCTIRTYSAAPLVKVSGAIYPSLATFSKSEGAVTSSPNAVKTPPTETTTTATTNTKTSIPPPMHNLPARPPYPHPTQQKVTTATTEATTLTRVTTTSIQYNRLPITPIIVSKPQQPTTVLLPQPKSVHTLEPPKLVTPADARQQQDKPRVLPQLAGYVPAQPRFVLKTTVPAQRAIPAQGLLTPTIKIPTSSYPTYLPSIVPATSYAIPKISKEATSVIDKIVTTDSVKLLPTSVPVTFSHSISPSSISPSPTTKTHAIIISPQTSVQPHVPTSEETKSFTPVIQETAKIFGMTSPNPSDGAITKHSVIHLETVKTSVSPVLLTIKREIDKSEVKSLEEDKKSPSLVRVVTSTPTIVSVPYVKLETTVFKNSVNLIKEEQHIKVQTPVEKVTEELNKSLKKEEPEVKEETNMKPEQQTEKEVEKCDKVAENVTPPNEDSKAAEISTNDNPTNVESVVPPATPSKSETEVEQLSKDLDKFDEEKADTESVLSDTSKERSSAELLNKDDAADSKEDSDYWSAKDVNIDSVIKTLCSADELSDRSSEVGKDEWLDENKIDEKKDSDTSKIDDQDNKEGPSSTDTSRVDDESYEEISENIDDKELSAKSRRAGRGRGRKPKTERAGVQTRRGKTSKETPKKGNRTSRAKTERKVSKSESKASGDIYEFQDDSDENISSKDKERLRLVLTLKSPSLANSGGVNNQVFGVKEVKEQLPLQQKPLENKEEFASPVSNTRKSRRLQERDVSKSNCDDMEDARNTTVVTRAAAASTPRRSARQTAIKAMQDTPRKSPRSRKKDRRGSETTDDSSEEKSVKNEPISKSEVVLQKEKENIRRSVEEAKPEPVREKPYEGRKAAVFRRLQGEMNQEPMTLIDPVTGLLTPMRECEEGRYSPVPKTQEVRVVRPPAEAATQPTVITAPQTPIAPKQKPQSFKQHVLSSEAAKAVVSQQQQERQQQLQLQQQQQQQQQQLQQQQQYQQQQHQLHHQQQQTPPHPVKPFPPKQSSPINQNLNVNVSLPTYVPPHVSPRTVSHPAPIANHAMPIVGAKTSHPPPPPPTVSQVNTFVGQKQFLQQATPPPTTVKSHMVSPQPQINAQIAMAHAKTQPQFMKQPPMAVNKSSLPKSPIQAHQQILTGSMASPPLKGAHQQVVGPNSRLVPSHLQTKGAMEPPKIEASLTHSVMVPRPNISPQGQTRHMLQAGMPVPAYEASLRGERSVYNGSPPPAHQNSPSPKGEAMAHFPPAPLCPPHDLHYMHRPHNVMYQQYLRQPYHLPRSVPGGIEKPGDGQEGEEAPVTSPPLEIRRPGSVGLTFPGHSAAVPHALQSPHDRATDSPQIGQVYNLHSARMPHYHPGRFYDSIEPPPAHRPQTSHSSLAALGSDRPLSHLGPMGTPDRPHSSHSALAAHIGSLAATTTDRALAAAHLPPERPLSSHGYGLGAGLGAAGNLMGALTRHIGADAPATQRGLQAATPPHASQVPAQAESLLMLLKQYPCMWQGLLALKNDQAAVQMYFVSGCESVAKYSLPKNTDGSTPPLRIFQRMRLEPPQVDGVTKKMQMENEHCMLLALPCGHDHIDVLKQNTNLTHGFITYLQQKQAAGIVNVPAPGTTQPPAYVVHIFPSCDFVNENLRRIAPSLLERVADIAHLLIVITTV